MSGFNEVKSDFFNLNSGTKSFVLSWSLKAGAVLWIYYEAKHTVLREIDGYDRFLYIKNVKKVGGTWNLLIL